MSTLCSNYHVGIRTVRDVLQRLRQEGYIHTEERRPAVVIYRREGLESDGAIRSVLERRQIIHDVHRTISLLMPAVFAFCANFSSADTRRQ